jgi:hypothetical protein
MEVKMSKTLHLGLIASGYGIAGVFAVLILFYILTKVLIVIFAKKQA